MPLPKERQVLPENRLSRKIVLLSHNKGSVSVYSPSLSFFIVLLIVKDFAYVML
jgi:hypothetical protein